jgi:hypothetical protein
MDRSFHSPDPQPTFWSGTYHGRQIATSRHSLGWVVYMDQVMLANRTFEGIEDAIRWLQRKVDDDAFDTRAAVLCRGRGGRRRVTGPIAA